MRILLQPVVNVNFCSYSVALAYTYKFFYRYNLISLVAVTADPRQHPFLMKSISTVSVNDLLTTPNIKFSADGSILSIQIFNKIS
jgi:hypothetical protein